MRCLAGFVVAATLAFAAGCGDGKPKVDIPKDPAPPPKNPPSGTATTGGKGGPGAPPNLPVPPPVAP